MRVFLSVLSISLALSAFSQNRGGLTDKVYFGGGFGFNAGTNFTNISVSPLVGYKITDRLSAGISITYQYNDYKNVDASFTHYGGGLFSRFMITRQFFATAEYEYLTIEFPTSADFKNTDREGFSSMFVGGGFAQPIGRNASFTIIGLYNLLYEDTGNSPYDNPFIVRAGFNVGF